MKKDLSKIIRSIAQELDCGCACYLHLKTNEIIAIPNFSEMIDEEAFEENFGIDLEKIQEDKNDYIKIEVLESFESFKIMERFSDQVSDKKFQIRLETALNNKKPFGVFKHLIDGSEYRQAWFDFKQNEIEKKVKNILECL